MTAISSTDLSKLVIRYCQLDDGLHSKKEEIKMMRQELNDLHDTILTHLEQSKIELVTAGSYGNVTVKTRESKSSINKDLIKQGIMETITKHANDLTDSTMHDAIAEQGTECILNNREVKIVRCLKRKKAKQTKPDEPKI